MATMTYSHYGVGKSGAHAKQSETAKPAVQSGFFARLMDAIVESKRRRAEIEVRRVRAIIEDKTVTPDYAMLPFSGQ